MHTIMRTSVVVRFARRSHARVQRPRRTPAEAVPGHHTRFDIVLGPKGHDCALTMSCAFVCAVPQHPPRGELTVREAWARPAQAQHKSFLWLESGRTPPGNVCNALRILVAKPEASASVPRGCARTCVLRGSKQYQSPPIFGTHVFWCDTHIAHAPVCVRHAYRVWVASETLPHGVSLHRFVLLCRFFCAQLSKIEKCTRFWKINF